MRSGISDKRLINTKGNPRFGLTFYILSKTGGVTAVSFYSGATFVVRDENGTRTIAADALYTGHPFD